jgi:hypothetical protein
MLPSLSLIVSANADNESTPTNAAAPTDLKNKLRVNIFPPGNG